jgi:hypothetical protein
MVGVLVSDVFHELVYSMHQYNYNKGINLVVWNVLHRYCKFWWSTYKRSQWMLEFRWMTLRHYLSTLPLSHGLLESSDIELNYTIIFSFHFFIQFNVVNLGVLLIVRYMSYKLPSKQAGSSNMNDQLSPLMPNTSNHTVIVWIKIVSYK